MSEEDKQFISQYIDDKEKIQVVENGVDVEWFAQKKRNEPRQPTILFVGTFKWLPNREAVAYLVKQIWPDLKKQVPNCRLWIVGNAPTDTVLNYQQLDDQITVTGGIPDIRDAFSQAHILIAPVLSGKGTRYKVLEAMAAGTPVVATRTAVEGLSVSNKEQVIIANDQLSLVIEAVELLKNADLRHKLSVKGRDFVAKRYDWRLISQKLDAIYNSFHTQ